jgi:hypothetical protein
MNRVRVTIDKLVLNGTDPHGGRALADALRLELSRVLADPTSRTSWARASHTPILRLGRMPLERGAAGACVFGGGVARAIGRGIPQ